MAMPVAGTKLGPTLHLNLHNRYVNVKAFGAVGDGVTDSTAAIQAAVDAAGADDGVGQVIIPSGNYITSSPIDLNTSQSVRITGTMGTDTDAATAPGFIWNRSGVRIFANFAGPMFTRTDVAPVHATRIEDIGMQNDHASGKGVELAAIQAPAGIYGCFIKAHIAVDFIEGIFNAQIANTTLWRAGAMSGSRGAQGIGLAHTQSYNLDINGFERGIWGQQGGSIIGGRIEANMTGIYLGGGGYTGGGIISNVTFEANDIGIDVISGYGLIAGVSINGHTGAPSGLSSDYGIDIHECFGLTLVNVTEAGSHTANFIRAFGNPNGLNQLTLIGCRGVTASNLVDLSTIEVINCTGAGLGNVIKAPVVATGSLPAAAAQQNGRLVIEDNGAGDRNLILYAGGQRFRIDGGAAV